MNSLNYLSRQLDVLATSGTPPSTPIKGTHLYNSEGPPRAKSYSRIFPRRPSHQNQQPQETDTGNPAHASKRSFSSPALWSFRKPSLTPSSSIPSTPAPALKRTTSYEFGPTAKPEITPPLNRSFIFHILSLLWDTIYRLWLTLSGYLVFPTWITGTGPLLKNLKTGSEADTTADEGEDEEDDGIVTRAPKRSSVEQQHKDALAISESLQAFQMSTTTTLVQEELVSHVTPPILSPDPPSEAEVQARTETPRIDLVPPTPRSKTPPSSLRRPRAPSTSLLPNPLSSSLLIKSASSPAGPVSVPQQTPPRKMPGHHMQKTLVLDLDETLIHSTSKPLRAHAGGGLLSMGGFGFGFGEKRGREAGHMVEVVLGGRCTLYHVYKRPFVDYFLRKVRVQPS
jgi:CTD nuclear envelope phosphatase 1